ncbi:type VI secretion system baseplate subunit TssK [Rubrivivax gelatinosus]|uniref:Type VI secretion system protein ImpJ n=1 Tax=Rubrivivax gelatinosus TaxID=28068 RepID=A0A4R2M961_RUBGE|nr:type VI secretion system baseplate subunit TssK [Rubrivivax gelatinosus]MBK1687548.1 type VI secretion system-associated protein [Rubrivivax gelatinosus]TCP02920.1 type VI secretion system protein ImpJ [Rubrivivax gelatinosus]
MIASAKILWGEGLFLRPQHFQRQDAYHEARLAQAMHWLLPHAWGLAALEVDEDALAAGLLRVHTLRAVMPDGEFVCAPRDDELPEPVALEPGAAAPAVWEVVLEPFRADAANHAAGEDRRVGARYGAHVLSATDWFTGAPEAELVVLRRRPRLQPAGDTGTGLPLLRLRRRAAGGFELDPTFVPPALVLCAVPALQALQRRLLDRLRAKVAALQGSGPGAEGQGVIGHPADGPASRLLQICCAAYARLSHLGPSATPDSLFGVMLELAGALVAFVPGRSLAELPAYGHVAAAAGFQALEALLRELLDAAVPRRCTTLRLDATRPSWQLARLDAAEPGPGAALYLSAQAEMPLSALIEAVPARLKLGAPDDLERLVHSAVAGVRLVHAAQLPPGLPLPPGACCFLVEPLGPWYQRLLDARALAVHVPEGLPQLRLALHVLAG